jgi:hypothetical protein
MDIKNQVLSSSRAELGIPRNRQRRWSPRAPRTARFDHFPVGRQLRRSSFNPATKEAYSTHGNGTITIVKETGPTSFEVEQNLDTMAGAKTLTLDTKTGHILTMAAQYGPPPTPPADAPPQGKGRGPARGPMLPDSFSILVVGK